MILETRVNGRLVRTYTGSSKVRRLRDILEQRVYPRCFRNANGCLIWTGGTAGNDRPAVKVEGSMYYIARVVLVVTLGRGIRPKHVAAHSCDTSLCIEPTHIEEASCSRNLSDAWARSRRPSTLVTL